MDTQKYVDTSLALATKAGKVIDSCTKRFASAEIPDSAWRMYSSEEMNRRIAQAQASAQAENARALDTLAIDLDAELENLRVRMEKTLHPLTASFYPGNQDRAQYEEERAERVVRAVGVQKVPAEYDEGMKNNLVDYCTELVTWAERLQSDKEPSQIGIVATLKRKHVDALGLGPVVNSILLLKGVLKDVEQRRLMLTGTGKMDLSLATDVEEASSMLRTAGLVTD